MIETFSQRVEITERQTLLLRALLTYGLGNLDSLNEALLPDSGEDDGTVQVGDEIVPAFTEQDIFDAIDQIREI